MGNKGFTLIELLTTIIILAVISVILTISVNSVIRSSKSKLSEIQISTIEEAASIYYLKNGIKNSYNNRSFKLCVNLNYLIENDYIEDESIKNIYDNKKLGGSVEIIYKSEQYTYKYTEKTCDYEYQVIDEICKATTQATKTTGKIPTGKYLPGDEYICEVKNNTKYHFFVVSTESDNVNLIMDRNVYYDPSKDISGLADSTTTGLVSWYSEVQDNSFGPVTAMSYLHNATKNWNNVPNIIMNYQDSSTSVEKTGYDNIKTTGNITVITNASGEEVGRIENLKTRMPTYDEIHGIGKCLTYNENGNNYASCPLWLSNYLNNSDYVTGEGLQNINGIYGYWTLSTDTTNINSAWRVNYHGLIGSNNVDISSAEGVRPVISIPKLDISN